MLLDGFDFKCRSFFFSCSYCWFYSEIFTRWLHQKIKISNLPNLTGSVGFLRSRESIQSDPSDLLVTSTKVLYIPYV